MNHNILLLTAMLAVATFADSKFYPNFPWFDCADDQQNPYSLEPFTLVRTAPSGKASTYCSTLHVNPVVGCDDPCCQFDLFKIAFDVFPSCKVSGARVNVSVNGVPIPIPYFETAINAPPNSTTLRIPKMGLSLQAEGAEICMTLAPNAKGEGCTTLEALCRPPPGEKPGVCTISYIDDELECCPVGVPQEPQEAPLSDTNFPFCKCNRTAGVTPFSAQYSVTTQPGRAPGKTSMYCFVTDVLTATDPTSDCGKTTNLRKAEFYANDTLRRYVRGIMLRPSDAPSFAFRSAIWGPFGNNTLKSTNINWTKEQAKGGQICIELDTSVDIKSFCMGGAPGTCKISLFDDSLRCCPVFTTAT